MFFDLFQEILKEFEVIYQDDNDIKIVNVTIAKDLDSDAMNNLVRGLE